MHLLATNIILWTRTLVKESLHEMSDVSSGDDEIGSESKGQNLSKVVGPKIRECC